MANKPGFRSSTGGIVIGDASVAFCSLDGSSSTDAFGVSVGNTGARPTNPQVGMLRWNTDLAQFEFYNGTIWSTLGGGTVLWRSNGNNVISIGTANFVNTATLTWNIQANGAQVNISATAAGGGGGGGTVNVGSNATYVLNVANLNFINTVSVNVEVDANVGSTANIAFNVNNAITNATFAVINASIATIDTNMNAANAAIAALNSAAATDNTTFGTMNTTFATVNTTFATINTEIGNLNAAVGTINTSLGTMNAQILIAENTVATYANGTLVLANANINFNNTATVNVAASANGTSQANIAFSVNTTAVVGVTNTFAVLGFDIATMAYDQANIALRIAKTTNATTIVDFTANATVNQNVFILNANVTNAYYAIVSKNGLVEVPTQDYTITSNNVLTFTSNCNVNDRIDARLFPAVAIGTLISGNGGGGGGGSGFINVIQNNATVFANTTNVNFVNTSTVTVSIGSNSTGQVDVGFTAPQISISTSSFSAVANQNTFTLTANALTENQVLLFINGVEQLPVTDYTVTGNTTLKTTTNCAVNDVVEARIFTVQGGLAAVGLVPNYLAANLVLGTANGPGGMAGIGGQTTYFAVPGVCQRGMVANFFITTNQFSQFSVTVASQNNGAGNVMLNTLPMSSNTFHINVPWRYRTDLGGDSNMYIAITNFYQGQSLNVTLTALDVDRFL